MKILSPLLVSKPTALALTTAAIIVFVLFAANGTSADAQQQQQQQQLLNNSQPAEAVAQNATLLIRDTFENRHDSFIVQVPEGWVIHDVNNTGSVLAAEVTQGYGILAQLCPGEEGGQQQQEEEAPNNISTSSGCPQVQQAEEIIHIIRYPNLGARIAIGFDELNNTVSDSVLEYVIQKLQEVGYRDINVINSTDTRIDVPYVLISTEVAMLAERYGLEEANIPARLVEVTYSTDSAPGEIRRGFLILTATNATPPNPETITGYSVFYEGVRAAASAEEQEETTTTAPSGTSVPPPAVVRQVFDSFELIPSEEAGVAILRAAVEQQIVNVPEEDEEEEEEEQEEEP
jgi:hypothetical protein